MKSSKFAVTLENVGYLLGTKLINLNEIELDLNTEISQMGMISRYSYLFGLREV